MRGFIKSLIQSLSEIPEGKFPPEYYTPQFVRGIIFGNFAYPSGLFAHVLFLVIFALIGVTILVYFNIFSVILWAIAIFLHRRVYLWQAYYLGTFEIIVHAAICTAVIGWDTGFQYYVLIQPAVVFLLPGRTIKKIIITAIYTCAFAAMNYYAKVTVKKRECVIGELHRLYIFSDGVYEVEKSDGSMWRFQEFVDFMSEVKTDGQLILDRLYSYARNLGNLENLEDDFTIVEVAFG